MYIIKKKKTTDTHFSRAGLLVIKQGQQVLLPGIAPVVTVTGHKEGSERAGVSFL